LGRLLSVIAKTGAGHYQLRWKVREHDTRIFGVSGTPSDVRAPARVRTEIRRVLRVDVALSAQRRAVVKLRNLKMGFLSHEKASKHPHHYAPPARADTRRLGFGGQ